MRISDWSSDVCSSDLTHRRGRARSPAVPLPARLFWLRACPCDPGRRELCRVGGGAAECPVGAGRRAARASQRQSVGGVPESGCIGARGSDAQIRSEEHTSELQSLMRISYAVFCLKKKTKITDIYPT